MSMSIHVFSNRPVSSMAEWQEAIDSDGFDALLYKPAVFEELSGFLPVRLDGAGTGFEVDHDDGAELSRELIEQGWDIGGPWTHALSFTFGGDTRELIAAFSTAASYARITDGVVFEGEEGKTFKPAEVLDMARKMAVEMKDYLEPPRYEWKDA
jgi:hypothetical protein